MTHAAAFLALAVALTGSACTEPGPDSAGDDLTAPQLPARGKRDIKTWLAAGYYQSWHCEPEPHAPRSPSGHGKNRICSNGALHAAAGSGELPVGAASVKEIFDGSGKLVTYAVSRKMTEGTTGDTWYWYEGNDDKIYANGEGAGSCTGCHAGAARDFVFTIAP